MIHAFFVEGGRVSYRNRYVRTPKWVVENAAGKALFGGFDPRAADPSVMGKDSGVANTNIVWHARPPDGARGSAQAVRTRSRRASSPRGYVESYKGRVTAHPKIDPETGEMVWFGYSVGGWFSKTMSYGVTDANGAVKRRDDFEAPFSSMVARFSRDAPARALSRPAADRRPPARHARRAGLRLGARQGRPCRRDGARRRRRDACAGSRPKPATSSIR